MPDGGCYVANQSASRETNLVLGSLGDGVHVWLAGTGADMT